MKAFLITALFVVVGLICLKLFVIWLEPRMTFFPDRQISRTPLDYGIPFDQTVISTEDGEALITWYLPHPDSKATILFFHGNAGNISSGRIDLLVAIYRQGYSLFTFDYRGFGKSSGAPTEEGIQLDSAAAVRFYWEKVHRPGEKVVYFGKSLGGFTSAHATTVSEPDGLILEATFPDKATLLSRYTLLRFLSLFSKYRLETISNLTGRTCPVLVIHGDADEVVPFEVGRELYERLPGEKYFFEVPGASHVNQYEVGGQAYWMRIETFINQIGVSR